MKARRPKMTVSKGAKSASEGAPLELYPGGGHGLGAVALGVDQGGPALVGEGYRGDHVDVAAVGERSSFPSLRKATESWPERSGPAGIAAARGTKTWPPAGTVSVLEPSATVWPPELEFPGAGQAFGLGGVVQEDGAALEGLAGGEDVGFQGGLVFRPGQEAGDGRLELLVAGLKRGGRRR